MPSGVLALRIITQNSTYERISAGLAFVLTMTLLLGPIRAFSLLFGLLDDILTWEAKMFEQDVHHDPTAGKSFERTCQPVVWRQRPGSGRQTPTERQELLHS